MHEVWEVFDYQAFLAGEQSHLTPAAEVSPSVLPLADCYPSSLLLPPSPPPALLEHYSESAQLWQTLTTDDSGAMVTGGVYGGRMGSGDEFGWYGE